MVLLSQSKDQASKGMKRKFSSLERSVVEDVCGSDKSMATAKSIRTGACKFDDSGMLDKKGFKMDAVKMKQCAIILRKLMTHSSGWAFNQPVDPVKLNIPDYFSIISMPMDLGSIKMKLEKRLYSNTIQFATDVNLTFSNAMRYNPPRNVFHIMAKELNDIFTSVWKSLELKWRKEISVASQQPTRKITQNQIVPSKQVMQKKPSCNMSSVSSKCLTYAEKLRLKEDISKFLKGNIPPRVLKFIQKTCLLGQSDEKIGVNIDILDEETLWKLYQIVNMCGNAKSTKVSQCRNVELTKVSKCGNADSTKSLGNAEATKLSKCGNAEASKSAGGMKNCSQSMEDSFKDSGGTMRSFGYDKGQASPLAYMNRKCPCGSRTDCHCSRHRLAVVDGDEALPTSHLSSRYATVKGDNDSCYEEELSPRALRAAMLKSRFAATISKAEQGKYVNLGERCDPTKTQRERKFEKEQQNEKAMIRTLKFAELHARLKTESERKMQRERERARARLALQKMEKTVDINEGNEIFKELKKLGFSIVELQPTFKNPLEKLGLFLKADYLDDDVDSLGNNCNNDLEEGEIASP